jgi:hypothetical protein
MPQDQESGAQADAFGRVNAVRIAGAIAATFVSHRRGNEAVYDGRKTVLKSAKKKTSSIGVSKNMLKHLDSVIAAFEQPNGRWTVVELAASEFKKNQRPTKSKGRSAGKVGLVGRGVFLQRGQLLGEFTLR